MPYLNEKFRKKLYYDAGFIKNIFCEVFPGLEYFNYFGKIFNKNNRENYLNKWYKGYNISRKDDTLKNQPKIINDLDDNKKIGQIHIKNLHYIDSIYVFCLKNKIKLYFTNIPVGLDKISTNKETYLFSKYFNKFKKINLIFDFPDLKSVDVRIDGYHLNNQGAQKTTIYLARNVNLISD
jgi:hypothetical protein